MLNLSVNSLSKSFQKVKAVDDFSFTFHEGIYGILGVNGSGKTTLLRILTSIWQADTGMITYNGNRIKAKDISYISQIGYMPQNEILYDDFTVQEFLEYMAVLKGMRVHEYRKEIDHLIEQLHLMDKKHTKNSHLSGGMKQRVMIAQALLNHPNILILDEPTAGLDPIERIQLRDFIYSLAKNRIILISTHVIQDIEDIATEILFMRKGKIEKAGTPREICQSLYAYDIIMSQQEWEKQKSTFLYSRYVEEGEHVIVHVLTQEPIKGEQEVVPSLEDAFFYYLVRGA